MRRILRLWFSLSDPVDRRTYLVHGVALMAVKYAVDAAVISPYAGRLWTPLDYLNPLLTARTLAVRGAPDWVGPALMAFALPFLWIGVAMTLRRAVDAGRSPWLALLFFVPGINYLLMARLCVLPSAARIRWGREAPAVVDERVRSALLGLVAAVLITIPTVLVAVYLRRAYSTGLFLGLPFTIGYVAAHLHNRAHPRPVGESIAVGLAGVLVAGGAMILFALEGAICTLMALPIAAVVAIPGALLGRAVAVRSDGASGIAAALLVPLLVAIEPRGAPRVHEVLTIVEIDASPDRVWPYVVSFPDLPPPRDLLFRAGVAAPIGARIDGRGVGATRYCDFTTGSFVEPVTAWEEGRRLAFDIAAQAPPLRELSPWGAVDAPHLDGFFRATRGEFRLAAIPGGRTRLEGRTWYVVEMFPEKYWTAYADGIVEAIHGRVLAHIAALAERNPQAGGGRGTRRPSRFPLPGFTRPVPAP
jgi:uncharacterized membrane protein YhaH (DUF805 family)